MWKNRILIFSKIRFKEHWLKKLILNNLFNQFVQSQLSQNDKKGMIRFLFFCLLAITDAKNYNKKIHGCLQKVHPEKRMNCFCTDADQYRLLSKVYLSNLKLHSGWWPIKWWNFYTLKKPTWIVTYWLFFSKKLVVMVELVLTVSMLNSLFGIGDILRSKTRFGAVSRV